MNYSLQTARVLPEVILTLFGVGIMLAGPLIRRQRVLGYAALAGLGAALLGALALIHYRGSAFNGQILTDNFSIFFRVLFILIAALVVSASLDYLDHEGLQSGEYYALILLGVVGQGLMAASVELVMIFIALEISSISTYILAGYRRNDPRSSEASLKYFLLGSFATAFLLYGIALVFGATGTTHLAGIRQALDKGPAPLVGLATALMFVGFGFKVAAAPFQVWLPDVYQGAPMPVTALLSAGPKAAAFAVFLRVFLTGLAPAQSWFWLLWLSAVLSMFVGNLAALVQGNIKRMLAYSSIAHAGYVMVAFTARSELGVAAALFYLAAYALMNLGAFMVVSHFGNEGERYVNIEDYRGLAYKHPALAAALSLFLLSLIGVPLPGGFFGKFYIFRAALEARLTWLTVLAVVNSVVAAYYYLRVIVVMYMQEPAPDIPVLRLPPAVAFVLILTATGTFYLGIFPGQVLAWATQSAGILK